MKANKKKRSSISRLIKVTKKVITPDINGYEIALQHYFAKRYNEARKVLDSYLAEHGNAFVAWNLSGILSGIERDPQKAEIAYRKALRIKPDYVEAHVNLGNLLRKLKRPAEAEATYREALRIKPDYVEACINLGNLLTELKRFVEAEMAYREVLHDTDARWNLSLLCLALGRYVEAWPYYELRYNPKHENVTIKMPNLPYPQWQGESLSGKSLLIWPEQGFGDYIQFVRYASLLKNLGVFRLTLFCAQPLKELLETVEGVDAVIFDLSPIPTHDYWSFPLSLPLHFGTTVDTIPNTLPYLFALPERVSQWRDRLPGDGFKVGLVWKGSIVHKNDSNRSLPGLATLSRLWSVPGVTFISLQKGEGEDEAIPAPKDQPLIPLGADIHDFADSAAIVAQLDLVICVDTAIAHVAGALGKPCWVLLPAFNTDWRWLLERMDSPWYPEVMRLFRQTSDGDWDSVVKRVVDALQEVTARGNSSPKSIAQPTQLRFPENFHDGKIQGMIPQDSDGYEIALQHYSAKRYNEARRVLNGYLAKNDNAFAAWNLSAILAGIEGDSQKAEAFYRKALRIKPNYTDAHNNLGNLLKKLNRLVEAEASYREALSINPDFANAHYNLGNLLTELKRFEGAEVAYRETLRIQPNYEEAHNNYGNLLVQLNRPAEAEKAYQEALRIQPNYVKAYNNYGKLLAELKRPVEAETAYRKALRIKFDLAETHNNLGNLLKVLKRHTEAEVAYREALRINPNYAELHCNFGSLLIELKRTVEAEATFREALRINPNYAKARTYLGMLFLMLGRYTEAWPFYESRYDSKRKDVVINLPYPQWQGESLSGKSLLIWPEQGFGDYIQFVRYAPLLKNRGISRLTLFCAPHLKAFLETVAGVDAVIFDLPSILSHDYWSFPLSLPLHFGTTVDTIPNTLPYLFALPERLTQWCNRFPGDGFKVGLVWKGNAIHENDANRSLPGLITLARLWSVPGVTFISLQKGEGEDEAIQSPKDQPIIPLGADIHDFADSAAIVAQLDLVICVDTAIAHVAGALGKPCWVLLPFFGTDWRWFMDRMDSPWYPGVMRLFRQTSNGNWNSVVEHVVEALKELVAIGGSSLKSITQQTQSEFPENSDGDTTQKTISKDSDGYEIAIQYYFAKRYNEARKVLDSYLTEHGNAFVAWNLSGILSGIEHDHKKAEAAYREALRIKPDCVDVHNNLGMLLKEINRPMEAEIIYREALRIQPNYAEAHYNLGNLLTELKRFAEAETAYREALRIKPDYVEAHNNLGNLLKELKRSTEAEMAYRQALRIKPGSVNIHYNLGNLLTELKCFAEAEAAYREALRIKPDCVDVHNNLGMLLEEINRFAEAESSYREVLRIKPDSANTNYNLANLLTTLKRFTEAEEAYLETLRIQPSHVEAYNNFGNLLTKLKRFTEAEKAYLEALSIQPNMEARGNLGLLLLSLGRYAEAWSFYESRYDPKHEHVTITIPNLPYPQWQGESLVGKSLLIWPEQGFGDYIQFARYAPLLKNRGVSRLTFFCALPLKELLETVEGVDAVISDLALVSPHDYWSFPLSLPLHFGTIVDTIPASLPYLFALPERINQWSDYLPDSGIKVGLVWKGSIVHKNDANRSLPGLSTLSRLWSVPGITFISLQKGEGENDAMQSPKNQPIIPLGTDICDFSDTAAIVSQLDLVICVDTAIAHVAGALGKPCWVLLPAFGTDWRWFLDRTDSPWYPGVMRLFRQTSDGDWDSVVECVVEALKERIT